jgi:GntR family phosphonate transport system transcriptional regulator
MTPPPKRQPIWASIAATLSAEIAAAQYRPGDKLPTEAALAARFGVNRHTVRHALATLTDQGLVHARRGSGVFVAATPADYPLGRRVRFQQNIQDLGKTPSRQWLRLETRLASLEEATALSLPEGALVHLAEGLSLADDQPLAMFQSVFPATRLPDLPAALQQHGSITAALSHCGVQDYTRASTKLTAIAADALLSLHLRLPQGAPVLRSVAVNIDAAGQPVEYGTTWFAGDRVVLTIKPEELS